MKNLRQQGLRIAASLLAAAGVPPRLRSRRRKQGDYRVHIIEYHEVAVAAEQREGAISTLQFRQHIEFLTKHYGVVSLSEAVDNLKDTRPPSRDLVVITFDDGYAGNYENAFPVLREHTLSATVFLTTGFLDTGGIWFDEARSLLDHLGARWSRIPDDQRAALQEHVGQHLNSRTADKAVQGMKYLTPAAREQMMDLLRRSVPDPPRLRSRSLTWNQAREMVRGGIEFGSHTVTHPILSTLPTARQLQEIQEACARIEDELGSHPSLFAYPNGAKGDFSDETVEVLRNVGVRAACTTIRGSNQPGCDLFRLRRLGVGSESSKVLELRLSGLLDNALT